MNPLQLTYNQMFLSRIARMIIPQSGMFNFAPPILRICRNLVEIGIRNVTDGVHLLCMPSFCVSCFKINKNIKNNVESKQQI